MKDIEELVVLYQDLVDLRSASEVNAPVEELFWTEKTEPASYDNTTYPALGHSDGALQLLRRTCYAYFEGELYTAIVIQVLDADIPPKAIVEYIGWGNKETLPLQDLKFIPPISTSNPLCRPGSLCWAINSKNGLWFTANFVNATTSGVSLTFKNETEIITVPLDWVSFTKPTACLYNADSTSSRQSRDVGTRPKRAAREIITPGGYRIPDALRINPQDTERVRQIKKKKISLLKKEQRREIIEEEAKNRQSSWKSHAAATAKKNRLFVKKQSIFTTSHAPDAKVGVTGSGKGMTHFITRSKHIFKEDEEDDI